MKKLTNNAGQDNVDLQALKESEARFRSIVLWSPDAIIVTDTKGKIEYVNPAAGRVFNRKVEGFIGTYLGLALVDGESTEIDIFRLGKDPGVGEMHAIETEWLNKKVHLITIRDITERKKAEEEIKQAAREWERTFDSISDPIFIQDTDHAILKTNKALAAELKIKPEEIVGKKCYELLHKTNSPWPGCPFERTKQDKGTYTQEVDDVNIGIPLLVTTSPILNDKGELVGSVHIAKDITFIKDKEKELGQKILDLETFHKLAVGRELKMAELKNKIKELEKRLGEKA